VKTDLLPHPLRSPCPACGCVDGVRRLVGGQETVRCAGCGRFAYNCPRSEINPSHQKPVFVLWNEPKSIAGWYCGSKELPSRLSSEPRRVHRLRSDETTWLFSGTMVLNEKLDASAIGRWVKITYKGETLTRIGNRFKQFTVTIEAKQRNEILNPDNNPVPF